MLTAGILAEAPNRPLSPKVSPWSRASRAFIGSYNLPNDARAPADNGTSCAENPTVPCSTGYARRHVRVDPRHGLAKKAMPKESPVRQVIEQFKDHPP